MDSKINLLCKKITKLTIVVQFSTNKKHSCKRSNNFLSYFHPFPNLHNVFHLHINEGYARTKTAK